MNLDSFLAVVLLLASEELKLPAPTATPRTAKKENKHATAAKQPGRATAPPEQTTQSPSLLVFSFIMLTAKSCWVLFIMLRGADTMKYAKAHAVDIEFTVFSVGEVMNNTARPTALHAPRISLFRTCRTHRYFPCLPPEHD